MMSMYFLLKGNFKAAEGDNAFYYHNIATIPATFASLCAFIWSAINYNRCLTALRNCKSWLENHISHEQYKTVNRFFFNKESLRHEVRTHNLPMPSDETIHTALALPSHPRAPYGV
jgi:hypothetical protein